MKLGWHRNGKPFTVLRWEGISWRPECTGLGQVRQEEPQVRHKAGGAAKGTGRSYREMETVMLPASLDGDF
ncbi:MAG: hypothetical protein ACLGPL_08485 [Acidobacteriota bacterium]